MKLTTEKSGRKSNCKRMYVAEEGGEGRERKKEKRK